MTIHRQIVDDFTAHGIDFVTTVPCKQLAGVIDEIENRKEIFHIPSNKEDEGMGLCAGAFMGGKRPAIIMHQSNPPTPTTRPRSERPRPRPHHLIKHLWKLKLRFQKICLYKMVTEPFNFRPTRSKL
ncbi:MAG: hypothetical protein ABGW82_02475, partial [Paracoccus sp. (in: a-proteobacteria)]